MKEKIKPDTLVSVSAKKQSGLDSLTDAIYNCIINTEKSDEAVFISRERHRLNLVQASLSLEKTLISLENHFSEEFVATDLSITMNHLATILGKVVEDELLDQIFNSFCIGK